MRPSRRVPRALLPSSLLRVGCLPARPPRQRADGPVLGSDRLQRRHAACAPRQAGNARQAPNTRRRDASPSPASARAGPEVALRVHLGAETHRSLPPALPAWSSEPERRVGSASRPIRICSAMPAASRSPTRATTRGLSKPTSGTRTFSTRCATPNWRPPGSRTSGGSRAVTELWCRTTPGAQFPAGASGLRVRLS